MKMRRPLLPTSWRCRCVDSLPSHHSVLQSSQQSGDTSSFGVKELVQIMLYHYIPAALLLIKICPTLFFVLLAVSVLIFKDNLFLLHSKSMITQKSLSLTSGQRPLSIPVERYRIWESKHKEEIYLSPALLNSQLFHHFHLDLNYSGYIMVIPTDLT